MKQADAALCCCSALQGLLRKLGAGFDDMIPQMGLSSSRMKVRTTLALNMVPDAGLSSCCIAWHTLCQHCLASAWPVLSRMHVHREEYWWQRAQLFQLHQEDVCRAIITRESRVQVNLIPFDRSCC